MTAYQLLMQASLEGVEVRQEAGKLKWRCCGPLPAEWRDRLAARRDDIAALFAAVPPCPSCRSLRDEKRRCWKCELRPCSLCGRETGSVFIETCVPCGLTAADN